MTAAEQYMLQFQPEWRNRRVVSTQPDHSRCVVTSSRSVLFRRCVVTKAFTLQALCSNLQALCYKLRALCYKLRALCSKLQALCSTLLIVTRSITLNSVAAPLRAVSGPPPGLTWPTLACIYSPPPRIGSKFASTALLLAFPALKPPLVETASGKVLFRPQPMCRDGF